MTKFWSLALAGQISRHVLISHGLGHSPCFPTPAVGSAPIFFLLPSRTTPGTIRRSATPASDDGASEELRLSTSYCTRSLDLAASGCKYCTICIIITYLVVVSRSAMSAKETTAWRKGGKRLSVGRPDLHEKGPRVPAIPLGLAPVKSILLCKMNRMPVPY